MDQSLTAQAATSAGESGGAKRPMGAATPLPALTRRKGLEQHTATASDNGPGHGARGARRTSYRMPWRAPHT